MPLTSKGSKILSAMQSQYGAKKGKSVFYASINKGKLKGVEGKADGGKVDETWKQYVEPNLTRVGELGEENPVIKAMGAIVKRRIKKAGAGAISPEFKIPWAARASTYGLQRAARSKALIGPTPGRADKRPENVAAGSYVVPADIVSAIGEGNSLAGHYKISKKFARKAEGGGIGKRFSGTKMQSYGGGKFRRPGIPGLRRGEDFAAGGAPQDVPIAASDGEHILQPQEVAAFGGGSLERGHDRLDKWVLTERRRHIKKLRSLKPPKKD